jgi:hypothetical protein
MNPNTIDNPPSSVPSTPVPQSPRLNMVTTPTSEMSSRTKWLLGTAIGGLVAGGGYLIYNKYQSYKERKRKEKIYRSK